MTETAPYSTLRYGTQVTTPLGPAMVIGYMDNDSAADTRYLVCYSRTQFTEEQWAQLCPLGAPCTYRKFAREELK